MNTELQEEKDALASLEKQRAVLKARLFEMYSQASRRNIALPLTMLESAKPEPPVLRIMMTSLPTHVEVRNFSNELFRMVGCVLQRFFR